MEELIVRYRSTAFALINLGVLLTVVKAVAVGDATPGSALYVWVLSTLCTVPLFWIRGFNDRYALGFVFMMTYFLFFGALSLRNMLVGSDPDGPHVVLHTDEVMTAAQLAVLLGAACFLIGYRAGSALIRRPPPGDTSVSDYSNFSILLVGVSCWTLGSAAMAYYAVFVTPENTISATTKGLQSMGAFMTFAVMLGNLMQPVGSVMLSYGYAKNRNSFWLLLVVTMVVLQVLLGFVIDTKGVMMVAPLLVALTLTLWDNKLSKLWVVGIVVFAMIIFPVMQAERVVRGELGFNRLQAFQHLPEILERSWKSKERVNDGSRARAQTFLERTSGESALEPIFQHVGVDTPFLHGLTFEPVLYAYIPRLVLPDKIAINAGLLYAQVFLHIGRDEFLFISFSVLGEFYWNFGWVGVLAGMLALGSLVGVVGAKSALNEARSITRLLMLLVSIMQLCMGFGGNVGIAYVLWFRAIAALGLMHLIFARTAKAATPTKEGQLPQRAAHIPAQSLPLYPNLLR